MLLIYIIFLSSFDHSSTTTLSEPKRRTISISISRFRSPSPSLSRFRSPSIAHNLHGFASQSRSRSEVSDFTSSMGSLDAPISAENGNAPPTGAGKSLPTDVGARVPLSEAVVPELDTSKRRRSSVLPLKVGTRVMCRWRDSKYHPVKVIERRRVPGCGPNDYEYYVHYTECMNPNFLVL